MQLPCRQPLNYKGRNSSKSVNDPKICDTILTGINEVHIKSAPLTDQLTPTSKDPCFHRILYCSKQTQLLKKQSRKKFLLHLFSMLTVFQDRALSWDFWMLKTSRQITHAQIKHKARLMFPRHIKHTNKAVDLGTGVPSAQSIKSDPEYA